MKLKLALLTFIAFNQLAYALPMDWSGSIGFDMNRILNMRKTDAPCVDYTNSTPPTSNLSCEKDAIFHTYVVRLQPSIIINDSATIKTEISTGSFRGGIFGDNSESSHNEDNQLNYFYNRSSGKSTIAFNQVYAELYADVGLVRVGRFAKEFGLGVVQNKGDDIFDRSFSQYDGLEAEFKIGSFTATPYWGKVSDVSGTPNGAHTVSELGISALYNNINTNLKIGLLYAKRSAETKNEFYGEYDETTTPVLGHKSNATLTDLYIYKGWEKFNIALEIPMITGEVENMYGITGDADLKSSAYIFEGNWLASKKWTIGLHAGMVSGQSDDQSEFTGMSLHPNYQIAEILYRYNYQGFVDPEFDIFQSGISNSRYVKLFTRWEGDTWAWNMAVIMAMASETAKAGTDYYNHEVGKMVQNTATEDQDDSLGTEFDVSFDYRWNPNVTITGYAGYLMTGDYFKYNGTPNENETKNVLASGLRFGLTF